MLNDTLHVRVLAEWAAEGEEGHIPPSEGGRLLAPFREVANPYPNPYPSPYPSPSPARWPIAVALALARWRRARCSAAAASCSATSTRRATAEI